MDASRTKQKKEKVTRGNSIGNGGWEEKNELEQKKKERERADSMREVEKIKVTEQ